MTHTPHGRRLPCDPRTWPTEVFAIEYTSADGRRRVTVCESWEVAAATMENWEHAGTVAPVLLRSDTNFRPADSPRHLQADAHNPPRRP